MVNILRTCDSAVDYILQVAENAATMKFETVFFLYVEFENSGTSKDTSIVQ